MAKTKHLVKTSLVFKWLKPVWFSGDCLKAGLKQHILVKNCTIVSRYSDVWYLDHYCTTAFVVSLGNLRVLDVLATMVSTVTFLLSCLGFEWHHWAPSGNFCTRLHYFITKLKILLIFKMCYASAGLYIKNTFQISGT